MIKITLIFFFGLIETFLYTMWCLSANRKELNKSTILMTIYMIIYLGIISYAIKDKETLALIISYSLACGAGNYLEILWEKRKK